ncbi:MAG: orotate phosphoribosyltransferase [Chloroflexi bacterium]|nr:orotate phosphoribosyltransferase [Chloroflexota bacterium]
MTSMPANPELLDKLRDLMQRHCFQYGDFTLTSGGKSKFYYNGKLVTLRPSGAALIGEALIDVVLASGAEAVGGPALGAVPIAMAVGAASLTRGRDLPVFVVRMEQKTHGARDLIAEPYSDDANAVMSSGRRVAIVEDTITTGGSVLKAVDAIRAAGCEVALIAVLVERHEGGADALREQGLDVVSLFRADEEGQLSVNPAFLERYAAATA